MKSVVNILVIALIAIHLNSCAGYAVGGLARASETGDKYATLAPKLMQSSSAGRIFVYRIEESTKLSLTYGMGLTKNYMPVAVDDEVAFLPWESFLYKDLPPGKHEVSCGGIVYYVSTWKNGHRRGDQKLNVSIKAGESQYVRLDFVDDKPTPVIVSQRTAELEMAKLPVLDSKRREKID